MTLRRFALAAALLAAPGLAAADEPTGCGAFRWSIDRERASLAGASKAVVADGGAIRYDEALTLAAPARPGVYKLTIASEGWIDVIDNGKFLHPKGSSGAPGCEGARKSVKFDLPGRPVDVQLSSVKDAHIALMVTPAE
jgi:hypothetical protein